MQIYFLRLFLCNFSLICKPRPGVVPKWYEKPYAWNQVSVEIELKK